MPRRPRRPNEHSYRPGHDGSARVSHGAFSERRTAERAALLRDEVIASTPWLAAPEFAGSVASYCRTLSRAEAVEAYLAVHGLLDADGIPRPAAELAVRLERSLSQQSARLGLDVRSRLSMARTMAETNALNSGASIDEGKRLWAAAEQRALAAAESEPPAPDCLTADDSDREHLPDATPTPSQRDEPTSPPPSPGAGEDGERQEGQELGQPPALPPLDHNEEEAPPTHTQDGRALGLGRKDTAT